MKIRDEETGKFVPAGGIDLESRNTANKIYSLWKELVRRVSNPKHTGFSYYGGAGISLHKPWHDFGIFRADILATIGPKPAGLSLCRIDLAKGFEPGNLKWDKHVEQSRRRRGVKLSPEMVAGIRALAGVIPQTAIAEQFGLHPSHVSKILSGQRWADVGVSKADKAEQLAQLFKKAVNKKNRKWRVNLSLSIQAGYQHRR